MSIRKTNRKIKQMKLNTLPRGKMPPPTMVEKDSKKELSKKMSRQRKVNFEE
jgi:hypothetical protein